MKMRDLRDLYFKVTGRANGNTECYRNKLCSGQGRSITEPCLDHASLLEGGRYFISACIGHINELGRLLTSTSPFITATQVNLVLAKPLYKIY
jgi:hypothetical protein